MSFVRHLPVCFFLAVAGDMEFLGQHSCFVCRGVKMRLIKVYLLIFAIWVVSVYSADEAKDRYLSIPILEKCQKRFMEANHEGRNFFYSGHDPELKDTRLDWLDSRNTCRERCMETVSFETQEKFDFFKKYIERNNISFVWTSGRLCDFDGCEGRWDLLPKRIKGWLWSANQVQLDDTNKTPPGWTYQPWSRTGVRRKPQPDNAEFYLSQTSESCLGVLNNMYNDSVSWHDIACYHRARFICEDSDALYEEAIDISENGYSGEPESTTKAATTTTRRTSVTTTRSFRTVASTTTTKTPSTTTKKNQIAEKTSPSYTTTQQAVVRTRPLVQQDSVDNNNANIRGGMRYGAGSTDPTLIVEEEVFSDEDYLDSTDDDAYDEEDETTTTTTTTKRPRPVLSGFRTRSRQ